MKYVTFAVPCYNSAAYMRKCIDTLLTAGEDAEIIVVNDGSKDDTGKIADEYAAKYPTIVRAIHQENGGHGEGVNQGLRNATGVYYKVVDSDDWLSVKDLKIVMNRLRRLHDSGNDVDLFFCNYVYEHVEDNEKYRMNYKGILPEDKIFTWDTCKSFHIHQYLMMHSMIFRTALLRDTVKLELPKHTFYVDNIYMLKPLPYVKKMYYMNLDLYRYFIGRVDQSVNQEVMIKRIDQHIRVLNILMDDYDYRAVRAMSPKAEKYITKHLGMLCTIASCLLAVDGTPESIEKRKTLWKSIKEKNPELYRRLCKRSLAGATNMPGAFGRFVAVSGYKITQKIFKYN